MDLIQRIAFMLQFDLGRDAIREQVLGTFTEEEFFLAYNAAKILAGA